MSWIIWSKNDLKVSQRKQVNDPSNAKLVTPLMNFKFQSCGIFEGFHTTKKVKTSLLQYLQQLWGWETQ